MRIRTANRRRIRNREKRELKRVCIVFNRGIYKTLDCGEYGRIVVPIQDDREQPRAYRKYPPHDRGYASNKRWGKRHPKNDSTR